MTDQFAVQVLAKRSRFCNNYDWQNVYVYDNIDLAEKRLESIDSSRFWNGQYRVRKVCND